MVLEMKAPHSEDWAALFALYPVFLSYALSFIYVAIYWNNHHHLLHTVKRVTGGILWANNNLLFWLSLVPFTTAWTGETHFARAPTIVYGISLLMPAIAFKLLQSAIIRAHPDDKTLSSAIGGDVKGNASLVLYVTGVALASIHGSLAYACFAIVAIIWLVPDTRIERRLAQDAPSEG